MAEMCNEGKEYACAALSAADPTLSSEDKAKLVWLAKQDVASPGSKVAKVLAPLAKAPPPRQGAPEQAPRGSRFSRTMYG